MNTFTLIKRRFGKATSAAGCLLGICCAVMLQSQRVQAATLQGATLAGYAGKGSTDGSGTGALFSGPQAVATDLAGNLYVADSGNNTIRKISPSGVSTTLAGLAGTVGSADGAGSTARFNQPAGIAVDSATNVYVADFGNHTIRQITPAGLVTTIAGLAGLAGSSNGVGNAALFFQPMGMAADSANNLYVADYGNHLIRKITPAHVVTTLAGTAGVFGHTNGVGTAAVFYSPEAVTVDPAGIVYVADTGNAVIRKINAGSVSTLAGQPGSLGSADGTGAGALFFQPAGIAFSSAGSIYVADYFNNTIRAVSLVGVVTTVAGLPGNAGSVDGTGAAARFWAPQGLAVDSAQTLYIADSANSAIRVMTPAGVVSTLAGSASDGSNNGGGSVARFYSPQGVAIDNSGNVYVADAQNSVIRKIAVNGAVSILAGTPGIFGSMDGSGATAQFSAPQAAAVDGSGNVYVADTGNNTIRKITSGGAVTTLAGAAGNPGNADGNGINAQFSFPAGVAVDTSGNVYIADTGNHVIRKITSGGVVSTLAGSAGIFGSFDGVGSNARFNAPVGIAVNSSGNIFVADYNNNTIRQVTPAGVVSTLAGWAGIWGSNDGLNNAAQFFAPSGIAADSSGNLYVADTGNHTIRKVAASGTNWTVTTVAGLASVSGSTDGSASNFRFYHPSSVAVSSAGGVSYLFVADSGNNTIRTTEGVPVITWANPSAITYGTALSGSQLNATATVPGTFAYTPATGTVLNSGINPLSVAFTPTDAVNNRGVSSGASIVVLPASLTVTAANARRAAGLPNPVFTGTLIGIQNSDNLTATYSSVATPASPAGGYPIVPSLVDPANRSTNYSVTLINGTLTVVNPPQIQSTTQSSNKITLTWSATASQTYQIESATNLSNPIWVNVGNPVTATNSIATGSDFSSVPQKFYRIQLSP